MVTNITNLSRSGLHDWMMQRVSALVLAAYTVFLLVWLLCHPGLGYEQWQGLFDHTLMKIFTLLMFLSLGAHAWVGMWTVSGDYLNERAVGKAALVVRFLFQALCGLVMFGYVAWGIQILWGF